MTLINQDPHNAKPYEVYAIKYGTRDAQRKNHFIGGDPHDAPMPMDYFVWLVRNDECTIVVDTGFNSEVGKRRGRTVLRTPAEGLALLGVDAASAPTVVITHLHYGMVRMVYKDRVCFHDGDAQIAPGVTVHRIGGHTHGMQCVRVWTQRGWLVLASDTSHYYEHFMRRRSFTTMFNIGEALDGYRKLEALAQSHDHIIPGHDPMVMRLYPAPTEALQDIAVRLDVAPSGRPTFD